MKVVILTKLVTLNKSLDVAKILCEESDESSDFVQSSDSLDGATISFEESDESSNF